MARAHTALKVEGGLLPGDFLRKLAQGDSSIPGLDAASYHVEGARLHDAIAASWNTMRSRWTNLRTALEALPDSDTATSLTRERFLLPLFAELQYGRLVPEKAREVDGNEYPISHYWRNSPIHLLGFRVPLDKRSPGVQGAARTSPHSLIQDYLNRTEAALWGFLSNGQALRILHDNKTMARPSFIEFDLVTMFETEAYSDFVILWLLCHQSRVESEDPYKCRLEQWVTIAHEQGTRALDKLRHGVALALNNLGQGFLEESSNAELRRALKDGTVSNLEYYRQVIRVVYRLMFLLAGEDRDLLFARDCNPAAKSNYLRFYSATRLREMAAKVYGTRHGDLWEGLKTIFGKLSDEGCADLALPALNSFLWDPRATSALNSSRLSNSNLLSAVRNLAYITEGSSRQRVDYKNIGAEEIGGIYENIIALSPLLDVDSFTFTLGAGAFSERDETASHYTATPLVDELLNSALDPVLDRASKEKNAVAAILALKVCDRACGSGHFLVASAKRMAKRLAAVRTGEIEPSPEDVQKGLRDVIAHCIYGVDLNATAVELCKFSLWLESMDRGRPLSFLENRIKVGNSLVGATPASIAMGIPDEAFSVLAGDDKLVVAGLKKQNRRERADIEQGQQQFMAAEILWLGWVDVRRGADRIIAIDDDDIDHIRQKQAEYEKLLISESYQSQKFIADAWCAAFVLPRVKGAPAVTALTFEEIKNDPDSCPAELRREIARVARQYGFFHWHLEFPDAYLVEKDAKPENTTCGWSGGFQVNLGNPPWDRVKLQDKEWFADRVPSIANTASAAKRKQMIAALEVEQPGLFAQFAAAIRQADGEGHLLRHSGLFPFCGRGDINVYAVFAEANRNHLAKRGLMGLVIPSEIASGDTTKLFFQDLVEKQSLVSLFDFENKGIFPGVHSSYKFCLITAGGPHEPSSEAATLAFFCHSVEDLRDPRRRVTLSADDIALLNPNTRTCPIFRSRRDAELALFIRRRTPPWKLVQEGHEASAWSIAIRRVIDINLQASLLQDKEDLEARFRLDDETGDFVGHGQRHLRLYEGKMINIFHHRFADAYTLAVGQRSGRATEIESTELLNPNRLAGCRHWVAEHEVVASLPSWQKCWLFSYMDVCSTTNERTVIGTIIPWSAPTFSLRVVAASSATEQEIACLSANFNSFCFDYYVRQFVGGLHLSDYIMYQMPVLSSATYSRPCPWSSKEESLREWLVPRVLELTYTAWDLQPFAKDCGYHGPPFKWNEDRRFVLRCEIDALFFHLYLPTQHGNWSPARVADGAVRDETDREFESFKSHFVTPRDAVDFIMETFPIVRKNDVKTFGRYRTKDAILEIYDAMLEAQRTGQAYQTSLSPEPADQRVAHPPRVPSKPLTLPTAARAPLADADYILLVALTALEVSSGEISTDRLMNACKLLALPDQLAKAGADLHGNMAQQWRRRFTDTLDPKLFLPTIRDLVARGAVKLVPQGQGSRTVWLDRAGFTLDLEIEFDVRFALEVGDTIAAEQLNSIPDVATIEQLRPLYSAA
jgi:hypothetical protein